MPLPPPIDWGDGDMIVLYDPVRQLYVSRAFEFGAWSLHPSMRRGEGFWYYRNKSNPAALPPQGTIYFNNFAPYLDAPFVGPDGSRLEGTNWVAQLYASTNQSGGFVPVGATLPFLTGAGAGYFDTTAGALRMIPFVTPGASAWVQARMWDQRTGTTFGEAMANGGAWRVSGAVPTLTGGISNPPLIPAAPNFNPASMPLDVNAGPASRTIFVGMRAEFSCVLQDAPGTVYQWQKLSNTTNWVNLSDATTRNLVFDPVLLQDDGAYRLLINQSAGHLVQLRVLPAPQFGG